MIYHAAYGKRNQVIKDTQKHLQQAITGSDYSLGHNLLGSLGTLPCSVSLKNRLSSCLDSWLITS